MESRDLGHSIRRCMCYHAGVSGVQPGDSGLLETGTSRRISPSGSEPQSYSRLCLFGFMDRFWRSAYWHRVLEKIPLVPLASTRVDYVDGTQSLPVRHDVSRSRLSDRQLHSAGGFSARNFCAVSMGVALARTPGVVSRRRSTLIWCRVV